MRLEAGNWKLEAKTGNEAWKPETGSEDRKRGLEAGNWKRRPETGSEIRKEQMKCTAECKQKNEGRKENGRKL